MRPNFLVVGAAKAGTTSLHHYMRQHPQIYLPTSLKESFYLCRDAELGGTTGYNYGGGRVTRRTEYERLFDGAERAHAIGEACVAYLRFFAQSIPEIRRSLDDPKIIILLRNPVDRAFSNYLHHVKDGHEPLSFEQAIAAGSERCRQGYWWGYDLVSPGLYHEQVEAFMAAFTNVSIHLHEDLASGSDGTIRDILRFLEVDEGFPIDVSVRHNVSSVRMRGPRAQHLLRDDALLMRVARAITREPAWPNLQTRLKSLRHVKPRMRARTRHMLNEIFADDIDKLERLIKRPLDRWRKANT
jgi:hypothetical protein